MNFNHWIIFKILKQKDIPNKRLKNRMHPKHLPTLTKFRTTPPIFINIVPRCSKVDIRYVMKLLSVPPRDKWRSERSFLGNDAGLKIRRLHIFRGYSVIDLF